MEKSGRCKSPFATDTTPREPNILSNDDELNRDIGVSAFQSLQTGTTFN